MAKRRLPPPRKKPRPSRKFLIYAAPGHGRECWKNVSAKHRADTNFLEEIMTPTSLIIVADRGGLKAYRVDQTPARGASLRLVQSLEITDAHGRYGDKLTDQAGSFPVSDGNNRHANSLAERTTLETENDKRICQQLAQHIAEVVKAEAVEGWSFAAPASIHAAVAELLPAAIRDRVVEHVKSDLVKIESAKLPSHFRSLQPL